LSLLAADPESADGHSKSPPRQEREKLRPRFGIRIYDTTASATADRAALLARRISELRFATRVSDDTHEQKDRIEVVALPLPESTPAKDREAKCIAHNEAERKARLSIADAALAASWFIVENFYGNARKQVFIITDLKDSWEDALPDPNRLAWSTRSVHGHFRIVDYDKRFHYSDDDEEGDVAADLPPDMASCGGLNLESLGGTLVHQIRVPFFRLGVPTALCASCHLQLLCSPPSPDAPVRKEMTNIVGQSDFRRNVRQFYICHFLPDGVLDMELAIARAKAAGVEVPRPVVIPLKRHAGWADLGALELNRGS
jgi:hypothetical protein